MSFICIYLYIFLNFSLNVHVSHHKQYDMLYNKIQVVVLQLWGQLMDLYQTNHGCQHVFFFTIRSYPKSYSLSPPQFSFPFFCCFYYCYFRSSFTFFQLIKLESTHSSSLVHQLLSFAQTMSSYSPSIKDQSFL